jgi:hypothetical protein
MAVNIQNGLKIIQHFPFQGPLKHTKNWDFGMKIYHLAIHHGCILFNPDSVIVPIAYVYAAITT